VDASLDYLMRRVYKSPDVLLDAPDLLGEQGTEARAHPPRALHVERADASRLYRVPIA